MRAWLVLVGVPFSIAEAFLWCVGAPYLALLVPIFYALAFVLWMGACRRIVSEYTKFTLCRRCQEKFLSAENIERYLHGRPPGRPGT